MSDIDQKEFNRRMDALDAANPAPKEELMRAKKIDHDNFLCGPCWEVPLGNDQFNAMVRDVTGQHPGIIVQLYVGGVKFVRGEPMTEYPKTDYQKTKDLIESFGIKAYWETEKHPDKDEPKKTILISNLSDAPRDLLVNCGVVGIDFNEDGSFFDIGGWDG